ncbi:sensor histidine kinase [Agreia sp. COWG]|uniref:sensor histidine kinase n=1 Tax=Agreia sp. COWG TaxID=2773266 RepID=UPI0019254CB4|nr:ATP-binding protein [Agreia sp. COWG]CAD6000732.1 Histidine kinase [Agreia sp. COWG]
MALTGSGQPRLLARTSRLVGLSFLAASVAALLVPGTANLDLLTVCLPLYALLAAGFIMIGRTRSLPWSGAIIIVGVVLIVLVSLPSLGGPTESTSSAVALLASGALPALVICNLDRPRRIAAMATGFVATLLAAVLTAHPDVTPFALATSVVMGWLVLVAATAWFTMSISRALARIQRLGRAHIAERQASETEAQRRQGARLLHDTVLATLTLLAHSGVGVSPDALRAQAAEDARLLRQLRLGGTPMPRSSGAYTLEATETSDLGHTLESVRQRFDRMGLSVSWHGAGRILLPSDVLDAFLLSLAECLENVRRHSGVSDAEVTITQDDTTVRAMVTDAGVGFDLALVDSARLGLAESVVARIRDVGGRTRLFSSPGSGTTVVLEVPKL